MTSEVVHCCRQWLVRRCHQDPVHYGPKDDTSCGREGVYDGWHYSMHEAMWAYQQLTGLKPIGPHRRLADETLLPLFHACERCQGRGLLDFDTIYVTCPICEGICYVPHASREQIEEKRQDVLALFPEAGLSDPSH